MGTDARASICWDYSVPIKLVKLSGVWILGERQKVRGAKLILICLDARSLWNCRWQAANSIGIMVVVETYAWFQVRPAFLCLASSWLACTSIIASSGSFASVDAWKSEGKKYVVKAAAIRIVASASPWSSKASFAKDGSKKGSDLNQNQASRIASTVTQAAAGVRRTCAKNLQIFMHKHEIGRAHVLNSSHL